MHSSGQQDRAGVRLDRRGLLKVGMLGSLGLTLPQLLNLEQQARAAGDAPRQDSAVIILWMRGGPSQIDTWDPKPQAAAEYRGEFKAIPTPVPGIQLSEHMPKMASIMSKWSILRSVHQRPEDGNGDHSSGDQVCFTGYGPGPDTNANVYPSIGSIAKRQLQHRAPQMPAYVMIPNNVPGTEAAYLGAAWEPFCTQSDPTEKGFAVPNLGLNPGLSMDRMESRLGLMQRLDRMKQTADMRAMDDFHRQALGLVTGDTARRAFDIDSEPREVRECYGMFADYTPRLRAAGDVKNFGQRMLLARRMIEAGVRLVTVDCRWWDTHDDNFHALKTAFLPRFDTAYTALIEDLSQRGLLDRTMVVAWGEMGRSPRISDTAGRDHWPGVRSVAIAGGGVHGGRVIGSSDRNGAVPHERPILVQDVLATMYRHLGVNTRMSYIDLAGRPIPVLPCGDPIHELFA